MASISQRIPNFIHGMSDQPDELKRPGQVNELVNTIPDVTTGLSKRPGLQYIKQLQTQNGSDVSVNGKWFNIYKENPVVETEKYICNISESGDVRIWNAETGTAQTVTNTTSAKNYLTHNERDDLQALTINDYTFITNRIKEVEMGSASSNVRSQEGFIEVRQFVEGTTYQLGIYLARDSSLPAAEQTTTTATRVELTTQYFWKCDGTCRLTLANYDINLSKGTTKTGLKMDIITQCQSVPQRTGSDKRDDRYTHTWNIKEGGTGWEVGDKITYLPSVAHLQEWPKLDGDPDSYYGVPDQPEYNVEIIEVEETTLTGLGPGTVISEEYTSTDTRTSFLAKLETAINAASGYSVEIIGNGLYVSRSDGKQFVIAYNDPNLFNVISSSDNSDENNPISEVSNVSQLPSQCKHRYIAKVNNLSDNVGAYYVKFKGDFQLDGKGTWEECANPGLENSINRSSMPHQIKRLSTIDTDVQIGGDENIFTFEVGKAKWASRLAGDDTTVPRPSFCPEQGKPTTGKPINNLFLYRNRMVFLSDENIIMSKAGDYTNFWGDSALAVSPDDPIDISCATSKSSVLYDGIVVNNGLVLFSNYNQFLVTTDADVLSPTTVKSSLISSYSFNKNTAPISIGTNVSWFSSEDQCSRFYEMTNVQRDSQVKVVEQSKLISKSLPKDLDILTASNENGLIISAEYKSDDVWLYKYFNNDNQRVMSSWFKWKMPDNMIYHTIMGDIYYAVVQLETSDYDGNLTSQTPYLVKLDLTTVDSNIYLDIWDNISKESLAENYDSVDDITKIGLPIPYSEKLYERFQPDIDASLVLLEPSTYTFKSVDIVSDGIVQDWTKYYLTDYRLGEDVAIKNIKTAHDLDTTNYSNQFETTTAYNSETPKAPITFATGTHTNGMVVDQSDVVSCVWLEGKIDGQLGEPYIRKASKFEIQSVTDDSDVEYWRVKIYGYPADEFERNINNDPRAPYGTDGNDPGDEYGFFRFTGQQKWYSANYAKSLYPNLKVGIHLDKSFEGNNFGRIIKLTNSTSKPYRSAKLVGYHSAMTLPRIDPISNPYSLTNVAPGGNDWTYCGELVPNGPDVTIIHKWRYDPAGYNTANYRKSVILDITKSDGVRTDLSLTYAGEVWGFHLDSKFDDWVEGWDDGGTPSTPLSAIGFNCIFDKEHSLSHNDLIASFGISRRLPGEFYTEDGGKFKLQQAGGQAEFSSYTWRGVADGEGSTVDALSLGVKGLARIEDCYPNPLMFSMNWGWLGSRYGWKHVNSYEASGDSGGYHYPFYLKPFTVKGEPNQIIKVFNLPGVAANYIPEADEDYVISVWLDGHFQGLQGPPFMYDVIAASIEEVSINGEAHWRVRVKGWDWWDYRDLNSLSSNYERAWERHYYVQSYDPRGNPPRIEETYYPKSLFPNLKLGAYNRHYENIGAACMGEWEPANIYGTIAPGQANAGTEFQYYSDTNSSVEFDDIDDVWAVIAINDYEIINGVATPFSYLMYKSYLNEVWVSTRDTATRRYHHVISPLRIQGVDNSNCNYVLDPPTNMIYSEVNLSYNWPNNNAIDVGLATSLHPDTREPIGTCTQLVNKKISDKLLIETQEYSHKSLLFADPPIWGNNIMMPSDGVLPLWQGCSTEFIGYVYNNTDAITCVWLDGTFEGTLGAPYVRCASNAKVEDYTENGVDYFRVSIFGYADDDTSHTVWNNIQRYDKAGSWFTTNYNKATYPDLKVGIYNNDWTNYNVGTITTHTATTTNRIPIFIGEKDPNIITIWTTDESGTYEYERQAPSSGFELEGNLYEINGIAVEENVATTLKPFVLPEYRYSAQVAGEWLEDSIIGYLYEAKVDLPTLYVTKKDNQSVRSLTSSSLTLHRVNFDMGQTGIFDVDLTRIGKDDYTMTYEVKEMDSYVADSKPIVTSDKFTVPIYDRSDATDITLTSIQPVPFTLYSMTWEGSYTDKYYKRV